MTILTTLREALRPPKSTVEELEEQLTACSQAKLASAEAVRKAEEVFDAEGTPAAREALAKAREEAEEAELYLARAERLLNAAREREEAEERERLEAELARRDAELTHTAVAAAEAPLIDEEARLLMEVARVRLKRAELAAEYQAKFHARESLYEDLHGPRPKDIQVGADGRARLPVKPSLPHMMGYEGVKKRMDAHRRKDDPPELGRWARALEPDVETYREASSYFR